MVDSEADKKVMMETGSIKKSFFSGDTEINPVNFVIKLKYKIAGYTHVLNLEDFKYLKIRNNNMYDIQWRKYEQSRKLNKQDPEYLKEFKEVLNQLDNNIYNKFMIPYSSYYINKDNFEMHLYDIKSHEKKLSEEKTHITRFTRFLDRFNFYYKNDLLKNQINDELENLRGKTESKMEEITQNITITQQKSNEEYVQSLFYFPLNFFDSTPIYKKILNNNKLKEIHADDDDITNKKSDQETGKMIIESLNTKPLYSQLKLGQYLLEKDLSTVTNLTLNKSEQPDTQILKSTAMLKQKYTTNVKATENCEIFSFFNLDKIIQTLNNIILLLKDYENGYKSYQVKCYLSDTKIMNIPLIEFFFDNIPTEQKKEVDDNVRDRKIRSMFYFNSFVNKFKYIIEHIEKKYSDTFDIISQINDINNPFIFFLTSDLNKNGENIKTYFKDLRKNLQQNQESKIRTKNKYYMYNKEDPIAELNTEEKRNKIIYQYAKYILSDSEYINDEETLTRTINRDSIKLKQIITYSNVHYLLENYYLKPGTILYDKFYKIKNNINKTDDTEFIQEYLYVKIKKINPINLNQDEVYNSFSNETKLSLIYEIDFEEIPKYSNLKFNINLIDLLNPNTLLKNVLHNQPNHIKIPDFNMETGIYKIYKNDIFSKNPNIESNNIYISNKLLCNNLENKFNIIKNNNDVFINLKIEDIKDILLINDAFSELFTYDEFQTTIASETNKDKDKEIDNDIILNYYINKFFFKEDSHLFVNGKYAQIRDVKIHPINLKSKDDLINYNYNPDDKFIDIKYSNTLRLAIDNIGSSYNVYLDVSVFYKNNAKDKIPLRDEMFAMVGCRPKALTIDKQLARLIGSSYKKNFFADTLYQISNNKINEKVENNEINEKVENKNTTLQNDIIQNNIKKGGNKVITKKRKDKKKNKYI